MLFDELLGQAVHVAADQIIGVAQRRVVRGVGKEHGGDRGDGRVQDPQDLHLSRSVATAGLRPSSTRGRPLVSVTVCRRFDLTGEASAPLPMLPVESTEVTGR